MKRHKHLWERLCSFENLAAAACEALLGIRADEKLRFAAIRKDDRHRLVSAGDTAMRYQFATQGDRVLDSKTFMKRAKR